MYVDPSGNGQFSTIQSAINSVPSNNKNWIYINIKEGVYKEQVKIPYDKPFIYLRGQNKGKTMVVWDAHEGIDKSATFISEADNILVRSITFMNSYNYPLGENKNPLKQAPAAMIQGDKCAFYDCDFMGIQDTLWDVSGRHLFKFCTIQGAVDFIFGNGRSIYEGCTLSVVAESVDVTGFITAQGRGSSNEDSGFVFKDCQIIGRGKTFLGRPWRPYARVIFYNSYMSGIITPKGWDPWRTQQTNTITFVESNCHGPGANSARRVKWMKNLSQVELELFTSLSFIDDHGWLKTIKF
ncbi:hypothetical protein Leryth_014661 [Lithospermum erythrorhizon]|nr:hypothetical protein Leryth_014661 [Lithospermum erythrorhizon]